ncbi:helix-turn-helix domain-containing protein [Propionibacterium freudenreichii]|uniref:hypothetical protein n=1 Tax=Propionibacterium freudenreichii TaxID=1744 RepID=UPI00243414B6|nr:hypothetical protein [Propionibacterium freudenreichii]WFF32865.1 helix-turn-helix domain-containing protein [Propionibacterium freudenreichii]
MGKTPASRALSGPLEALSPLTVDETSELIRKSARDVQRKISDGVFKTVEPPKRGRTPLITVASVRAYLEGDAS